MEISFQGSSQPTWKITEIPGGRGYDKHPLEWKFQEGGSSVKTPYFLELHITAFTVWYLTAVSYGAASFSLLQNLVINLE